MVWDDFRMFIRDDEWSLRLNIGEHFDVIRSKDQLTVFNNTKPLLILVSEM